MAPHSLERLSLRRGPNTGSARNLAKLPVDDQPPHQHAGRPTGSSGGSGGPGGGLSRVVGVLKSGASSDEEKAEACKKIASLCTVGTHRNYLVQDALYAEGAVQALLHVACATTSTKIQKLAVLAMSCTCELHQDAQEAARQAGAVDFLVDLLRSGSLTGKEVASTALIHLTDEPSALEGNLGTPEGIDLLISLIKYEASSNLQTTICENCAWVLGNVSCAQSFHRVIRLHGGIPALLYLLEVATHQRNTMLCYRAVWSLCNLAADVHCQNEIRTCNGIPLLTLQLGTGDVSQLQKNPQDRRLTQIVAHIISNLAVDPRNQQELLDAGVIPVLMKLLDAQAEPKIRLMASWALSNLAANPRTHQAIHRCDGVWHFVDLLKRSQGDHWVMLRMAVALGNMACDNQVNRDMIREAGGIQPLVRCLSLDNPGIQERGVIALENLSTDNLENQQEIGQCGALRYLTNLVYEYQSPTAAEKSVGVIYNLCGSDENIQLIWASGVVSLLEALVSSEMSGGSPRGANNTELVQRAELALQRLVPSRAGIIPELNLDTAAPHKANISGKLSQSFKTLSSKMKVHKPAQRPKWRATLTLPIRKLGSLLHRGKAAQDGQMEYSEAQPPLPLSSSDRDARNALMPITPRTAHMRQNLPTWDSSIIPESYGAGIHTDPSMKVYDVQSLVLSCPKSPASHRADDQSSTGSASPMYSTRCHYKQADVAGQNYGGTHAIGVL